MRLLIVNDQFESGGAGRVTATMCCELARRGYDIELVADNINFPIRYTLPVGVKVHSVEFISKKIGPLSRLVSLFKTAQKIRSYVKVIKPDLILAVQANGFIRAFIANRGMGIPIIAIDHTSFARKMDFINTLTRHYLYRYADGLSILTKRDEKLLGDKYPKKKVIYNPLTYPLLKEIPKREKTILCVGRFDIWQVKGFDLIVEIWAELAAKYPDWKLVFAGTGKDENINYIKGLLRVHQIDNFVHFLGQVDDMKTLYAHSGIFALPSRIEGFPMVLLEALSQGCPSVAFSVGGASDEMMEEGAGFVIEDGNLEAFRSALSTLMENNDIRDNCSRNAVKSASRFTIKKFGDAWEQMINETMQKGNTQ